MRVEIEKIGGEGRLKTGKSIASTTERIGRTAMRDEKERGIGIMVEIAKVTKSTSDIAGQDLGLDHRPENIEKSTGQEPMREIDGSTTSTKERTKMTT